MPRRFVTLLSAASLLLCAAAALLWARAAAGPPGFEDRASWVSAGGRRFTVRSADGRVGLFAAPVADLAARPTHRVRTRENLLAFDPDAPLPPGRSFEQAWAASRQPSQPGDPNLGELVGRLRRTDPYVFARDRPPFALAAATWPATFAVLTEQWYLFPTDDCVGATSLVDPPAYPKPDILAALLPLLEDPGRAVAAHVMLCELTDRVGTGRTYRRADGQDGVRLDGLTFARLAQAPGGDQLDPAELAAVRDEWHRRLDVPLASAPWWALTAALAAWPAARLAAAAGRGRRRRSRRRAGLCLACGYDLRAATGRCPECGTGFADAGG